MGVPVAARNIFPSNIQGLPTWYEVRVVEAGWRGRRGGVDLMVAMNPQTWDKDLAEIEPAATCSTTRPSRCRRRSSATTSTPIGMPLTAICNAEYSDPRQRQLFKNIIYLGALSALLDIDPAEIEKLFGEQYKGKEALLESNRKALHLGRDYALANFDVPAADPRQAQRQGRRPDLHRRQQRRGAGLRLRRRDGVPRGIRSRRRRRWPRRSQSYCRKFRTDPATGKKRYAIVQAEDELASIGMVIGAAWNGARAFTATSGPGISLMQEFLGLAYFAEIPGGALRRAARQPVDRHADAHAAGRPPVLRLRVARRHQARAAVSRGPDASASSSRRRRSTSPTGCRRRSS